MEYGVLGLLVLIADIYAIIKTWSSTASVGAKIFWTLLILVLPVLGVIIWWFAGSKGSTASHV